jgi:hypothetical protein
MFKYPTTFTLSDGRGTVSKHIQSFKTEQDFEDWRNYQLMNGWKIIDEFDFKAEFRNSLIERYGLEYFLEHFENDKQTASS